MKLSKERIGNILLVHVDGELDLVTAPIFGDDIDAELQSYERLAHMVIDLSKVDFIDSSGLGAILGRYKRIGQRGGQLLLANATPRVLKILELSGVGKLMPHYASSKTAIKTIQGGK